MHSTDIPSVKRYLQQFEGVLHSLTPDARAELVNEILSHIEEALAAAPHPLADTDIDAVLKGLGDPTLLGESLASNSVVHADSFNQPARSLTQRLGMMKRPRAGRSLHVAGLVLLVLAGVSSIVGAILKPIIGPDLHLYHFGFALPPAVEMATGVIFGGVFLWASGKWFQKIRFGVHSVLPR